MQLEVSDDSAEDQGPREVYDYRGNKTLDLGGGAFAARSVAAVEPSHALTWDTLKAVCVQLLLSHQHHPLATMLCPSYNLLKCALWGPRSPFPSAGDGGEAIYIIITIATNGVFF